LASRCKAAEVEAARQAALASWKEQDMAETDLQVNIRSEANDATQVELLRHQRNEPPPLPPTTPTPQPPTATFPPITPIVTQIPPPMATPTPQPPPLPTPYEPPTDSEIAGTYLEQLLEHGFAYMEYVSSWNDSYRFWKGSLPTGAVEFAIGAIMQGFQDADGNYTPY